MGIIWFNEKPKDGVATLYSGNITLNKTAIEELEDAYSVMLGLDYTKKQILIKPLSKDQDQRGDIPEKSRYKITIRSSYGRVSNKEFMDEIAQMIDYDFQNGPLKMDTFWNPEEKLLVIKADKKKEVN